MSREGGLYGEVQCIIAPPLNRMTDTYENITFPQLRWWAVKCNFKKSLMSQNTKDVLLTSGCSYMTCWAILTTVWGEY